MTGPGAGGTDPGGDALGRLAELRAADPPTHGGRVLSYVYDSGRADLDEVAAAAAAMFLPVNGLDPTTFTSVGVLERDLVAFGREVLNGDGDVVGSVTSGGTESCLLAVLAARERWRAARAPVSDGHRPVLVIPTTAHPAFRKAAHYLDLEASEVSVDPVTTAVDADRLLAAVDAARDRVALVVASAPGYPTGVCDPVGSIAAGCAERGVDLHVDACIGGFVLPWWPTGPLPGWDLAVPGVTSISADLHKYGYAPKGASLLLHRGRERHRARYWATSSWPGYPVVNPTALGSRSATAMAAAWAITRTLGADGYAALVRRTHEATSALRERLQGIVGLRVVGEPTGPLLAVATADEEPPDDRVDPFLLIDAVRARGFALQAQPAFAQPDGTVLPRSAHLTVTPVTLEVLGELVAAVASGAREVRGAVPPPADARLLERLDSAALPSETSVLMTTLEGLPPGVAPDVLARVLAGVVDPDR